MTNCLFLQNINQIGGIETFLYEMAKIFKDYDITIYYIEGDIEQIKRLKKYVRVKQYKGEKIICKKAIFNFTTFGLDNIEAEEIIQVIHADYIAIKYKPTFDKRINRYIAVSKQVAKSFEELYGIKCDICYNPIQVEKPRRVLNLISATRLAIEKGKNRMIQFAKELDLAGIPYLWTIFTNDTNEIDNPNIVYMKPRLDIRDYIANADYTVQLSDTEGFCYTINESLCLGTPVIVTDCPSFKEMGIKDGYNGFVLDFDLSNINTKAIYESRLDFKYEPKKDTWDKYLVKSESTYQKDLKIMRKVQCIEKFYDIENNMLLRELEDKPFMVNKIRAEELKDLGLVEILE